MNKNTKFLPLFKEDLLPGDRYTFHESTRKTLQRHKTPVKLLNSAPRGLLLQRRVPEYRNALAAVSVPAVPSSPIHSTAPAESLACLKSWQTWTTGKVCGSKE